MQLCKNPKCTQSFKVETANPTRKYCSRECYDKEKSEKTARLKELKKKYEKIPEREKRAIRHIYDLGLKNPTDTQIKDICSSFIADWHTVKENLELQELCTDGSYFNY